MPSRIAEKWERENVRHRVYRGNDPSRPSSTESEKEASTTILRHRRELRYSRDQDALSTSLSGCTSEPSVEELQLSALERVRKELQHRIQEHHERIQLLRDRLANQADSDEQSRDFFLRQRLLEEHRLAATCKEELSVMEQLDRLKQDRRLPSTTSSHDGGCTGRTSRMDANLSLFLQNSPTKVSLGTSLRPLSADSVHRGSVLRMPESSSRALRAQHRGSHLRTRSLHEETQIGERRNKEAQYSGLQSPASEPSPDRSFLFLEPPIAAVDEFRNSFSSRVIAPPRTQSKRASSLRMLHASTKERRNLFGNESGKASSSDSEFGNVTIIPYMEHRSRTEYLNLEELSETPLPAYAQCLMEDFELNSQLPPVLSLVGQRVPETSVSRKPVPLSPIIEQPSPQPSVKGKPSPNLAGHKAARRQRSIFTLRLPLRPSAPASESHLTLPASASSTSFFDSTDEHYSPPSRIPISGSPLRRKGLPSTRNHDLAVLGAAPDDMPASPALSRFATVSTTKSRTTRPLGIFRDVKNKLIQLGRH